MSTILDFLNSIIGLPVRYNFLLYIIAGVFALVLLDGIITFLFGSINSIITGGRK